MDGIGKVIEELGLMILTRDMELKDKQNEIEELKKEDRNNRGSFRNIRRVLQ